MALLNLRAYKYLPPRASQFSSQEIALKRAATAWYVGGKVLFSVLVMTGCEMPPGGLSQESGSGGVELFELSSPFRHCKHTLTTKCVIDVPTEGESRRVPVGQANCSSSLTHTQTEAFKLLNHCRDWLKGFRKTWQNEELPDASPPQRDYKTFLSLCAIHPSWNQGNFRKKAQRSINTGARKIYQFKNLIFLEGISHIASHRHCFKLRKACTVLCTICKHLKYVLRLTLSYNHIYHCE